VSLVRNACIATATAALAATASITAADSSTVALPQTASVSPSIAVSAFADGRNAGPLQSRTLRGAEYVRVNAPTGTRRAAAPVRNANLRPGAHQITARVASDRTVHVIHANFVVAASVGFSPAGGRPYASTSTWNIPIPAAPVLDPSSSAMVRHLSTRPAVADLYEFGFPVYNADASTAHYAVNCIKPWGICGLERRPVPIPAGAVPSPGSDGAMVVIDWSSRLAFDFWQARRTAGGGWTASWGTVSSIDGDGRTDGATGPALPVLGGLIRTAEIERGHIDHAVAFSTDNACQTVFRFPARKTDGYSSAADCIPEGSRVQLNPRIDLAGVPGITRAELAVGRALQIHGAYVRDNGGATMAFGFESPTVRPDPYPAAGLPWDYAAMPHIPWSQLRVLRQWDGR
jgi:hypothetical protein